MSWASFPCSVQLATIKLTLFQVADGHSEERPYLSVRLLICCADCFLLIRAKAMSDQAALHGPVWQFRAFATTLPILVDRSLALQHPELFGNRLWSTHRT